MAYFLNSEERERLNKRCEKCLFGRESCPIKFVQHTFNYEAKDNKVASGILNSLIKDDGECSVFKVFKEYLYIKKEEKMKWELEDIYKKVCDYFQWNYDDINEQTKKRDREIVKVRQISHFLAREYTPYSTSDIGKKIGKKNHATVLHSVKTVNNLIETDPKYRKEVLEIRKKYFEKDVV